jgi:hypothetical protein
MIAKYSKLIVAAAVAMFLAAIALYIVLVKIPSDLATNISQGIKETFHFTPEVRVNETIVIEQHAPIMELATVSHDLLVEYSWSHEWLGSTKTIALRGTFTAKAGFDLQEPFSLSVQKSPLRVHAQMPAPKLLSLQINSYKVLQDENGWWNRISPGDREAAVNALQQTAREKAQNSGLLAEARTTIEQRIREIVERNGAMVEFAYPWQERR